MVEEAAGVPPAAVPGSPVVAAELVVVVAEGDVPASSEETGAAAALFTGTVELVLGVAVAVAAAPVAA